MKKKRKVAIRFKKAERNVIKSLKIKKEKVRKLYKSLPKKVKSVPKQTFALPIQTAVVVPSTYMADKKITPAQFLARIREVRNGLSRIFGGFTQTRGYGGYYSDDKKLVIREKNAIVYAFAEKSSFYRNKAMLITWVKRLRRKWKQESVAIIIENDMFYIS